MLFDLQPLSQIFQGRVSLLWVLLLDMAPYIVFADTGITQRTLLSVSMHLSLDAAIIVLTEHIVAYFAVTASTFGF